VTKSRRLTDKRLRELWQATSSCYDDATEELGYSNGDVAYLYKIGEIDDKQAEDMMRKIDELYRKNLCSLSSDILEDILKASEKKKQKRARATIENISTELLERQIRNEKEGPS
jgi:hypothetical protein